METTGNWSSAEQDKVHGRHRISGTVMPWTAVSILPACMGKDLRASVWHRDGTGRKSVTHREGSSRGTDGDGTELSSPERSVPPATFGSNGWTTESQIDKEKGTDMQLTYVGMHGWPRPLLGRWRMKVACRRAYIAAQITDRMQFNLLACCDRNKEKKQPGKWEINMDCATEKAGLFLDNDDGSYRLISRRWWACQSKDGARPKATATTTARERGKNIIYYTRDFPN
jgi:hypothetical protein